MSLSKEQAKEVWAHFPKKPSKELMEYITEVVLKYSRYLFVTRSKSGQQYGYCTHCKKNQRTDNLKHGKRGICSNCQSECWVKHSGRGRKSLRDTENVIWYEKSLIDPNIVVARSLFVIRDYTEDYTKTETKIGEVALYVFQRNGSHMYEHYWWNKGILAQKKTVFEKPAYQNQYRWYSEGNIKDAVKGTTFQYSTWERYDLDSSLKVFDLASKYPCVEYLTKMGLSTFVQAKLYGYKNYGTINWRAKSIDKVLRLDKQDFKSLMKHPKPIEPFTLFIFQMARKSGMQLTFQEAEELSNIFYGCEPSSLKELCRYATLIKIKNYVQKQFKSQKGKNRHYYSESGVVTAWRDYHDDCQKLNMDLSQSAIFFPKDLYKAHQSTIKKVKYKEDQILNAKFQKRAEALKKYEFESGRFILRPPKSSKELIEEGNALIHCVGGYAKKHANGQTNILLLRKKDAPEVPFYTIEIKSNRITQSYGYDNSLPTKEIKSFLDKFTNECLTEKTNKSKKKRAISA